MLTSDHHINSDHGFPWEGLESCCVKTIGTHPPTKVGRNNSTPPGRTCVVHLALPYSILRRDLMDCMSSLPLLGLMQTSVQDILLDGSSTIMETRSTLDAETPRGLDWGLEPGEVEMQSLLAKLRVGDATTQRISVWMIANLAIDARNRESIVKAGSIFLLVQLMRTDSSGRADGLRALANLSCSQAVCGELADVKGVEVVLETMRCRTGSHVEQSHCMSILTNLCKYRKSRSVVVAEGGCQLLLEMTRWRSIVDKCSAFLALMHLSEDPDARIEICRGDGIKAATDALTVCSTPGGKSCLARLLGNLAKETTNGGSFEQGCCACQLVQLLSADHEEVALNALESISHLAHIPKMRVLIAREGGIRPIISLLQSRDKRCSSVAIYTLAELSKCGEIAAAIARKGGVRELVRILREDDQLSAVLPLANIAQVEGSRGLLTREECIPLLVSAAVVASCTDVRLGGLRCLSALSKDRATHDAFLEKHVVHNLVSLVEVGGSDAEAAALTCWIVGRLSEKRQGRRLIQGTGVVSHLIEVLEAGDPRCKKAATYALSKISPDRKIRMLFANYERILPTVIKTRDSGKVERDDVINTEVLLEGAIPLALKDFVLREAHRGTSLYSVVVRFLNMLFSSFWEKRI